MPRYQVRLDDDTALALRRIALSEDRSMAAQLRHMIRQEAGKKGIWPPQRRHLSAIEASTEHPSRHRG